MNAMWQDIIYWTIASILSSPVIGLLAVWVDEIINGPL